MGVRSKTLDGARRMTKELVKKDQDFDLHDPERLPMKSAAPKKRAV
jgi:hypothetical protein